MRILLGSHYFSPSVGGIETASELLAREFVKLGHEVRAITQTPGGNDFDFPVIRRPDVRELIRQVAWCDVFLQNNISLRTVWPLVLIRRPLFVPSVGHFRQGMLVSVPLHLDTLPGKPTGGDLHAVLAEAYRGFESGNRTKDLIYVGRLVSDKGVDLLIEALSILAKEGMQTQLTITGDGPDRAKLEEQVVDLGLAGSVEFVGSRTGQELAEILNRHRILVAPSRWPEPFGIVALEAIACGCVVIGSDQGGLPEAIGPCGVTFPNNDACALANALSQLINDPTRREELRQNAGLHLARFTKGRVAEAYLDFIEKNL